jgi:hypothetical protein
MEQEDKQRIKWVNITKIQLSELTSEFYRYRLMFRILFCYLIFDVLNHFNFLS